MAVVLGLDCCFAIFSESGELAAMATLAGSGKEPLAVAKLQFVCNHHGSGWAVGGVAVLRGGAVGAGGKAASTGGMEPLLPGGVERGRLD